ncbi:hypothetical protein [Nonomuraea cypriaca]|nr:hypothetical protein [Nonomuraea cypriaca]
MSETPGAPATSVLDGLAGLPASVIGDAQDRFGESNRRLTPRT